MRFVILMLSFLITFSGCISTPKSVSESRVHPKSRLPASESNIDILEFLAYWRADSYTSRNNYKYTKDIPLNDAGSNYTFPNEIMEISKIAARAEADFCGSVSQVRSILLKQPKSPYANANLQGNEDGLKHQFQFKGVPIAGFWFRTINPYKVICYLGNQPGDIEYYNKRYSSIYGDIPNCLQLCPQ